MSKVHRAAESLSDKDLFLYALQIIYCKMVASKLLDIRANYNSWINHGRLVWKGF